jgi:hypothetical protein
LKKYPNLYFKDKECPSCSSVYTPEAPSQKYCSAKCRGKNSYYKRNYGLTEAQYEDKKKTQQHKCKICGEEGFCIGNNNHTEKLVVDHDHNTGQIRDLLCHNCNRALGLLQDSVIIADSALQYLKRWKAAK